MGEIKVFWFLEPVESLGGRMAARKRGTSTCRPFVHSKTTFFAATPSSLRPRMATSLLPALVLKAIPTTSNIQTAPHSWGQQKLCLHPPLSRRSRYAPSTSNATRNHSPASRQPVLRHYSVAAHVDPTPCGHTMCPPTYLADTPDM